MNRKSSQAVVSPASEAILSEAGELERQILNFETVIPEEESLTENKMSAVNDVPQKLHRHRSVPATNSDVEHFTPPKSHLTNYLIAGVIVILLIALAFVFTNPFSNSSGIRLAEQGDKSLSTQDTLLLRLEDTVNQMVTDNHWSDNRVKLILQDWQALEAAQQAQAKNSAWYKHFAFLLENRISNTAVETAPDTANPPQSGDPLLDLAQSLGMDNLHERKLRKQKIQKLVADYAPKQTLETEILNGERLNNTSTKQAPVKTESKPKTVSNDSTARTEKTANTKSTAKIASAQPVEIVTAQADPKIEAEQVSLVLTGYQTAYEQGNTSGLLDLFANDAVGTHDETINMLKANFESVFNRSVSRTVRISGVSWRSIGDSAEVTADYNASLQLAGNKGKQAIDAKLMLHIAMLDERAKISKFELINPSVRAMPPALGKHASTEPPSNKELQNLISRFIAAYDSGDLGKLEALFAQDAKTNSQADIDGIRDEYKKLFASTGSRRMKIEKLAWTVADGYAKGVGELSALIQTSPQSKQQYTLSGKIQLVARKENGKVYITHLYHIEHPQ